jgi:Bacterial Ig domain
MEFKSVFPTTFPINRWVVGASVGLILLLSVEYFATQRYGRVGSPRATAPATASVAVEKVPVAVPSSPEGWIDQPTDESVSAQTLSISGWALDSSGIDRVEARVAGKTYLGKYGLPRPDVAAVKPGFPNNPNAGFTIEAKAEGLSPMRHIVDVVAIARSGKESLIGRRGLIPPSAKERWRPFLPAGTSTSSKEPFFALMATSGVALGGAEGVESAYPGYQSSTLKIGLAVPLLYMRTTKGAAGDFAFDPGFDLSRKCKDRPVVDDNLNEILAFSRKHNVPVQIILNGGIWGAASCESKEWDLTDHLESNPINAQWSQDNQVFPADYLKGLHGSTESPLLARVQTYNVYAKAFRRYKKRNLQSAARMISAFAKANPDLFVAVALDADTYMNPFFAGREIMDYNPGMIRQFREWLQGSGPYAGHPTDGAPDLRAYRRASTFTVPQIAKIARRNWTRWDEVDPPRKFPGSYVTPEIPEGSMRVWDDPWWHLWDEFRKHIVDLHYDELSTWIREAGIPKSRIFSAQGFIRPDPGNAPFAMHVSSRRQNYDSSGVSVEGSIPRDGHLGVIIYGEAARNDVPMEDGHSMFATFARMDPGWGVVEFNSADLKNPLILPTYAQAYGSFRDIFNFDAREIAFMAWNGSNGQFAGQPGYVSYTAWRGTPAEEALRDFMISHAELPPGARLWTFGAARHADSDGWTSSHGTLTPIEGAIRIGTTSGVTTLVSPPDQVFRTKGVSRLVVMATSGKARIEKIEGRSGGQEWQVLPISVDDGRGMVDIFWQDAAPKLPGVVEQLRVGLRSEAGVPMTISDIALIPVK